MFNLSFRNFTAPWWFLLLIVVAAIVVGYVVVQRMRHKRTMRFTNLALLERVVPKRQGWVRHVPAIVLVIALMLLTTAMAGPTAEQRVPRNRATVMLVIDVSLSMEATDVRPTRLRAAQDAAKEFVTGLTPGINLGLIAFAGTATVLVSPTTDRRGRVQGDRQPAPRRVDRHRRGDLRRAAGDRGLRAGRQRRGGRAAGPRSC